MFLFPFWTFRFFMCYDLIYIKMTHVSHIHSDISNISISHLIDLTLFFLWTVVHLNFFFRFENIGQYYQIFCSFVFELLFLGSIIKNDIANHQDILTFPRLLCNGMWPKYQQILTYIKTCDWVTVVNCRSLNR